MIETILTFHCYLKRLTVRCCPEWPVLNSEEIPVCVIYNQTGKKGGAVLLTEVPNET